MELCARNWSGCAVSGPKRRVVLAAGAVLALASPAWADVGLPMLVVVWPVSWVLLVPIVVAEWLVARRVVPAAVPKRFRGVVLANVVSTLVGIPVTWAGLVLVELVAGLLVSLTARQVRLGAEVSNLLMVTLSAPWIPPFESKLDWMVPAAALTLLVPFYFMSVAVEARVFQRVTDCPHDVARMWSRRANGISYGGLVVLVAGVLVHALATH
jgi:hypothetical protein